MNKTFDIQSYIGGAEARYSAANGNNYSNFEGGNYAFLEAEGGAGAVAPNAKSPTPYQLIISNTTGGNLTAVLFGQNRFFSEPNFGSDAGITVTPSATNVSYAQLLNQSAFQPFDTSLIRIQGSATQITQLINVNITDANGQTATIPLYTQNYFSAYQFQSGFLDVPFNVKIDGNTSLSFVMLGGAPNTVFMTFFPAVKVNPARLVTGQGADVVYSPPSVNLGGMTFPKPAMLANRPSNMLR
jgi:hypothetical protein